MSKSRRKRSSSKRHNASVCVDAGDTGEACRTCGRLAAEMTDPFKAVPSSLRYRTSGRVTFALVWISGWYIYLLHTCTHSQLRDAQFAIVCVLRLKDRGQTRLGLGGDRPQAATHENCSYSQWCRFLLNGLSATRKSHLEIKQKTKSPRWREALSYVQVKLPSRDKTRCIMAQLLVSFATSKSSPHVIQRFRRLNLHTSMFRMCQKTRSETREKRKQTIPVEPLLLSPTPKKTKQNKNKRFVHLFVRRGGHES